MEKQLALIADSANISIEGKLNILGEFDTIFAADAPATHPTLWFVAKLLVDAADSGTHKILLHLVDEDGNTVLPPLIGEVAVPPPGPEYSGEKRSIPVVLGVRNVTFPQMGTYSFELRVDDQTVAEVPLYLRKPQAPAPEG
ncbi:MAG: hypothetical protein ABSB58_00360 [Gemmatimonadales bacterium]